jgi:hypothetical protein
MTLPLLRPGQTHTAVTKLKTALVRELKERDHHTIAGRISLSKKTYGGATVKGVKQFQRDRRLLDDGIVGKDTWGALGFHEPVVDERPPVLNGVPWEAGVLAVDGRWVDKELAAEMLRVRRAGRWRGNVYSGFRPPWYQKRLFDAAVRKYGSVEAARKWVAPPGKSRHGMKAGAGAADVTAGAELDAASAKIFRPMDWEPWHVQLVGAREAPDDVEVEPGDPPAEDLEASGLSLEDVDATIEVLLERADEGGEPRDAEHVDEGYDPEAGAAPG